MKSFFEGRTWPAGQTLLHLYVLPNPSDLEACRAAYIPLLDGDSALAVVPERWTHATLLKIGIPAAEIAPAMRNTLAERLQQRLAAVPAFELVAGPALVGASAVVLDLTHPTGFDGPWTRLRTAAAEVVVDVLGAGAVARLADRAHITLAYGLGPGDSGQLQSRLRKATGVRCPVRLDRVYFVDVQQNLELSGYRWKPVAELMLG